MEVPRNEIWQWSDRPPERPSLRFLILRMWLRYVTRIVARKVSAQGMIDQRGNSMFLSQLSHRKPDQHRFRVWQVIQTFYKLWTLFTKIIAFIQNFITITMFLFMFMFKKINLLCRKAFSLIIIIELLFNVLCREAFLLIIKTRVNVTLWNVHFCSYIMFMPLIVNNLLLFPQMHFLICR